MIEADTEILPLFVPSREEALALKKTFELKSGINYVRLNEYAGKEEIAKRSIHFVDRNGVVKENEHPFIIVKTDVYECMYGRDRHLARKLKEQAKEEERMMEDHPLPPKRAYRKFQASKKKGCPATMVLKEVIMFTNYKMNNKSEWERRHMSKAIRSALNNGEVTQEHRVYIKYPTNESHHTHAVHEIKVALQLEEAARLSDQEEPWTDRMLRSIKRCTTFTWDDERRKHYKPFMVDGVQVGIITPDMLTAIKQEPDLFRCTENEVHLSPSLSTYAERTDKMASFLQKCRTGGKFVSLAGWRHENFAVSRSFYDTPLFEIERSATCLFGIKQYGVHVNGYCRHPTQGMCLWVGKRSPTKQTYPGKLDQIAAGGLPANLSIKECMMKECEEEASIPQSISSKAIPTGAVSYFYEDRRGLLPETQFIFDLELPLDFEPRVKDGEVSEFFLWPVEKVKQEIASEKFKPNCALICLQFLIRHGYITPDNEPHYLEFLSIMHHDHF